MIRIHITLCLALSLFMPEGLFALVKYDEGQRQIMGVQLLQDNTDQFAYYYVPQFPRLATKSNEEFEFLCLKYVGEQGEASGGLFHALIEFTLPPDVVEELEKKLQKEIAGARIVGPIPMMQAFKDGQEGVGSFEIVSAVLSDKEGESAFTRSVITSDHAPLMPGSKAVVAAILNQQGATLLWNSLTGPTSDVSASIHAYYEAAVRAYNAIVTAEMSTVYEHFSKVSNVQQDYTKRQIRKISDQLQQDGVLKVEVFDRSKSLGISASEMDGILQVVTDKLTELMFDTQTGWAKEPERETAVEANQIQGRQKRGWFARVFGGAHDTKYYTDNQFVLKKREDIRTNKFQLNLSKTTTIKVPVHASGNIGGLYEEFGTDNRYFRIVDLNDPAFQRRDIHFQVDGDYIDSFENLINFVSVNFRKVYGNDNPAFTHELYFNHADVKNSKTVQMVSFPRLGISGPAWLDYEYKITWSLRGIDEVLRVPVAEDEWIQSSAPAISLTPPFQKRILEIDADRSLFKADSIATAIVEFASVLAGEPRLMGKVTLRAGDPESSSKVAVYHDKNEDVVYRVSWYARKGQVRTPLQMLETDYLFLVPPSADKFVNTND